MEAVGLAAIRGLVGHADPPRRSAPDAERMCRSTGIRAVAATGEHAAAAATITGNARLAVELWRPALSPPHWTTRRFAPARQAAVTARILPGQKLRIVSAERRGEVPEDKFRSPAPAGLAYAVPLDADWQ